MKPKRARRLLQWLIGGRKLKKPITQSEINAIEKWWQEKMQPRGYAFSWVGPLAEMEAQ